MAYSPPLSLEAAARLSTAANIAAIQVVRLVAVLDEPCATEGSLTWKLKDPTFVWERDGQSLVALLPLDIVISLQPKDGAPECQLGMIHVGYRVEYALKEEPISDEDLPHFVGISGFMHVWPYLRSEVQSLTAKIGLPALTLPVMVSGHAAAMVTVKHVREALDSNTSGESDGARVEKL